MFPAIYSYYYELYSYAVLLTLTSLISANYWRDATHGWRRDADLLFAKISFTVFVANGLYYVRITPYVIVGYPGLFLLSYCYYLSGKYLTEKNGLWWRFHMLFHLIMMCEQMMIIDSIVLLNYTL